MKKHLTLLCLLSVSFLSAPAFAEFGVEFTWKDVDVHGFISQGFLKSDSNNFYAETKDGTFQFNEFGANFLANLSDRLHLGMQLFSRDIGDISNNSLLLDWAYGDYRWKDQFGFRAGKLKIPYGLYNDTRDIDAVRTAIFLPQSIYDETEREMMNSLYGIEFYGYLDLRSWGTLDYQAQYGDKDITNDSAMTQDLKEDPENQLLQYIESIALQDMIGGSVEWETPLEGLRLKAWLAQADWVLDLDINDPQFLATQGIDAERYFQRIRDDNMNIKVFSLEYVWNNLILAGEYMTMKQEEGCSEGYYAGLSYRLNERLELGTYYAVYYDDVDDRDGKEWAAAGYPDYMAWQKDFALSARVDINDHWLVKLEGHAVNGVSHFYIQDNPDGFEENSYLLAIKTTYSF